VNTGTESDRRRCASRRSPRRRTCGRRARLPLFEEPTKQVNGGDGAAEFYEI